MLGAARQVVFLSRLFGGTRPYTTSLAKWIFLSRLFGGTQNKMEYVAAMFFLSRLFGGTLQKIIRTSCKIKASGYF